MQLRADDPLAGAVTRAIQEGDIAVVEQLLRKHPGLAGARIRRDNGRSRTVLHQVADWPGFFPNGPAMVRTLVAAGADVNARGEGQFAETPLHWAASSDDLDVAEALIEAGADLELAGASIAGGTALDNAIGYGCWQVARLLVQRGARVDKLWHAAAMGMVGRLHELMTADPAPAADEINHAFYQACAGAQRRTAELLLARGADIQHVPRYSKSTPLGAATALETRRNTLAAWLRDHGATSS